MKKLLFKGFLFIFSLFVLNSSSVFGTTEELGKMQLVQQPKSYSTNNPPIEVISIPSRGLLRYFVHGQDSIQLSGLPSKVEIRLVAKGQQSDQLILLGPLDWKEVKKYESSDVTQYTFFSKGAEVNIALPNSKGFHISVLLPSTPTAQYSAKNDNYDPEPNSDPDFLVKDVLIGGDCFDVNNISLSGRSTSSGTFSSGLSSIGIDEGVILGTGNVSLGVGPNNITDTGSDDGVNSNDPDLQQMVNELFQGSNQPIFDATILEFEFTPTIDSITFEYVFASEEYCDYVNSEFNDVFGFFISGPGINGNFSNNGENIAIVPGTNDYVSINTLNINTNAAFFTDNVPVGQNQNAGGCTSEPTTPSPTSDFIEYDGFSVPLQAIANVIPCETYTIKLAIADVGDGIFDSGVMLAAESFQAGGTALLDVESDLGGNVFLQGCTDGGFTVRRGNTNNFNEPFEVTLTIDPSSTAEPGVDYEPFDTVIVIPSFSMEVFVDLITLPQFDYDGEEKTIILVLDNSCSCEIEETVIIIEPVPPLESDLQGDTVCIGSPVFFDPSEEVYSGVDYQWSDGQVGPAITVYPIESGFYYVTLSNACDELIDTAYVEVVDDPKATLEVDTAICESDLASIDLNILFEGRGPFSFSYTINGNSYLVDDYTDSIYSIPVDHRDTGRYRINFMSGYLGCTGDIEGGGELRYRELNFQALIEDASCGGNADGRIEIIPDSSALPYVFEWEDGSSSAVREALPVGQYTLTLTDGPGCTIDTVFQISESSGVDYEAEITQFPTCNRNNGAIRLQIDSSDFQSVNWSTGDSSLVLDNLSPGTYTFSIETFTICDIQDSIIIPNSPPLPRIELDTIWPIQCNRDTGEIFIDVVSQSSYSVQWSSSDTLENLRVTNPGSYEVIVVDSLGCSDSLQVDLPIDTVQPSFQLPNPTFLSCVDSSVTFMIDSLAASDIVFSWRNSADSVISQTNQLQVFEVGQYTVEFQDTSNGCSNSESLFVQEPALPEAALLPLDTLTCIQTSVDISFSYNQPHLQFVLLDALSRDTIDLSLNGEFNLSDSGGFEVVITDTLSQCQVDTMFQVAEDRNAASIQLPDALPFRCLDSVIRVDALIQNENAFDFEWTNGINEVLASEQDVQDANLVFDFQSPGLYYLTITDSKTGCVSRDSVQIVPDTDLPVVDVQPQGVLTCDQTTIDILSQGSSFGPNFNYRWLNPNGTLLQEDVNQVSLVSPGTYTLEIRNTDNGCTNQEQFVVEQNIESPIVSAGLGDPFTCSRRSVIWQYTGPDSVNVDVSWFQGASLVGDTTSLSVNADDVSSFYTLRVRRLDNGCIDSLQISPQWDTLSPLAVIDSIPVLPCDNTPVVLSGGQSTPGGELNFEWRFDGVSIGETSELAVTEVGGYTLWVQSEANGCTDSTTVQVESDPIVDFDLQIDPLLCTRPYGEIEVSQILGGSPPFQFSLDNGPPTAEGFFSDLQAGDYLVSIEDALGCRAEKLVQLDSLSDLTLDLTAEVVLNYNQEYQIVLDVNRTDDEIAVVDWNPANQLSCTQCLSPRITAIESQEIGVYLEDIYGCTAEAVLRLIVELNPQIFIPNVFTPNGDGINDSFFPNAGPTVVNIPEMMVFDRWGNLVFEQRNFPPNSAQMGWDGRYKGDQLKPAVFAYVIKVELVTGEILTFSGDVTLVK